MHLYACLPESFRSSERLLSSSRENVRPVRTFQASVVADWLINWMPHMWSGAIRIISEWFQTSEKTVLIIGHAVCVCHLPYARQDIHVGRLFNEISQWWIILISELANRFQSSHPMPTSRCHGSLLGRSTSSFTLPSSRWYADSITYLTTWSMEFSSNSTVWMFRPYAARSVWFQPMEQRSYALSFNTISLRFCRSHGHWSIKTALFNWIGNWREPSSFLNFPWNWNWARFSVTHNMRMQNIHCLRCSFILSMLLQLTQLIINL